MTKILPTPDIIFNGTTLKYVTDVSYILTTNEFVTHTQATYLLQAATCLKLAQK